MTWQKAIGWALGVALALMVIATALVGQVGEAIDFASALLEHF